jgi:hypothetical protein
MNTVEMADRMVDKLSLMNKLTLDMASNGDS